jgi:hypothetical protein
MVLAFFHKMEMVYTNYVTRGTKINTNNIVGALRVYMKAFYLKWSDLYL